jgi:hypothetical protein
MRGVWKGILPRCDFEEETVIQEITNIGREPEIDGLENDVFENCSMHARKNSLMMISYM